MTRQATWRKDEIAIGLHWLLLTDVSHVSHIVSNGSLSTRDTIMRYVDMRWANFKVGSRYGWTKAEITTVRAHRDKLANSSRLGRFSYIVRDENVIRYRELLGNEADFPLPGGPISGDTVPGNTLPVVSIAAPAAPAAPAVSIPPGLILIPEGSKSARTSFGEGERLPEGWILLSLDGQWKTIWLAKGR
jgi:hypothetical protein